MKKIIPLLLGGEHEETRSHKYYRALSQDRGMNAGVAPARGIHAR